MRTIAWKYAGAQDYRALCLTRRVTLRGFEVKLATLKEVYLGVGYRKYAGIRKFRGR